MFPRLNDWIWASSLLSLAVLAFPPEMAVAKQGSIAPPTSERFATDDAMVVLRDGRRLHLKCIGAGEPTVMLDAGLGLDSSIWRRVQPQLSAITRTCAYDRAGYGQSDPGPLPRDTGRRASDLLELLDATVEQGPFLLVAHSAAERTARLVAGQRRDEVAGLVLVDPGADLETLRARGPSWAAAHDAGIAIALKCIGATAAGEMRPENAIYAECGSPPTDGPLASRDMATAVLSENDPDLPEVLEGLNEGSLGDLPVIVLSAEDKFGVNEGAAPGETDPLRRAWSDAGARIASSSTQGEQRIVPGASHVIQIEQPQVVIDAVRDLVERARSAGNTQAPVS